MLNRVRLRDEPVPIARLGAPTERAARYDSIEWQTPIDRTRWFFAETLTPLYYTPIYEELAPTDRLRYNQLAGMLANELILFLESESLNTVLQTLARTHRDHGDDGLITAILDFRNDELQHAEVWRRLNRLSEPEWYANSDRHLIRIPSAIGAISRFVARHPIAFPVVLWIQLAQEERSVEMSRRCLQERPGRLEPRFLAAYRAHLHDEVRHVQIDWHLIDRFYRGRSPAVRWLTARLLRRLVGTFFLTPSHSSTRVIEVLAAEHPELRPLVPRMLRELRALARSDDYHRMMYSRATTPVTFGLFDRFPEFRPMQRVLRAYEPMTARRAL
jgi:para-aminobenzoate N-oxygenase AurF